MKLYTNKHPILKGYPTIYHDNTLNCSKIKIRFETGKIFQVVGCTDMMILVKCRGIILGFNAEMFKIVFEETEVDLDD